MDMFSSAGVVLLSVFGWHCCVRCLQDSLRTALRTRAAEVQSLEAQVRSLEATRDR